MKSKTRGRGAASKKTTTRNSAPRPGDVSPRPPTFLAGYFFSIHHPTGRPMPREMLWMGDANQGGAGIEIIAKDLKDYLDQFYRENT